jgi:hypothetical protein
MELGMLHVLHWGEHCILNVSKIFSSRDGLFSDEPRNPISTAHIPRLLLRNPEIRRLSLLLSKTNIVIMAADKLVSQGLKAGEKERGRSGEMRNCQGQMGDRHVGRLVRTEFKPTC